MTDRNEDAGLTTIAVTPEGKWPYGQIWLDESHRNMGRTADAGRRVSSAWADVRQARAALANGHPDIAASILARVEEGLRRAGESLGECRETSQEREARLGQPF